MAPARTAATLALAAIVCGCSQPLLVFRGDRAPPPVAEEPTVTGSIERRPVSFGDDLAEEDWRRARAALSVALDPQGNGRPVKWDNPETGLKGSVNPTGLPYVADTLICRNFLASVMGQGRSRFVRGTGCKPSGGEWTLKRVRSAAMDKPQQAKPQQAKPRLVTAQAEAAQTGTSGAEAVPDE